MGTKGPGSEKKISCTLLKIVKQKLIGGMDCNWRGYIFSSIQNIDSPMPKKQVGITIFSCSINNFSNKVNYIYKCAHM